MGKVGCGLSCRIGWPHRGCGDLLAAMGDRGYLRFGMARIMKW